MKQIIQGTFNNVFNLKGTLYDRRIAICRECPIKVKRFSIDVCADYLYLNPKTNQIATSPLPGYYRGCGCILGSKTRVKDAHCPAGKW